MHKISFTEVFLSTNSCVMYTSHFQLQISGILIRMGGQILQILGKSVLYRAAQICFHFTLLLRTDIFVNFTS